MEGGGGGGGGGGGMPPLLLIKKSESEGLQSKSPTLLTLVLVEQ